MSAFDVIMSISSISADNIFLRHFVCSANGGDDGRGRDTDDVIGKNIVSVSSRFANDYSAFWDNCGGSTTSTNPRNESGNNSMNGGNGEIQSLNQKVTFEFPYYAIFYDLKNLFLES